MVRTVEMTEGELRSWGHGLVGKQLPRGWAPELSERMLIKWRKAVVPQLVVGHLYWVFSLQPS